MGMRRRLTDFALSACALTILFVSLAAFDGRVRERITAQISAPPASTEVAAAGSRAQGLATVLIQIAKDQCREHAPMMIFAVAATVLTISMLRV